MLVNKQTINDAPPTKNSRVILKGTTRTGIVESYSGGKYTVKFDDGAVTSHSEGELKTVQVLLG